LSGLIPELWEKLDVTNDELVKKIEELLKTDADLDFLLVLRKRDLEKLVACIRRRVDQVGGDKGHHLTRE
jgi:hypothetical protein